MPEWAYRRMAEASGQPNRRRVNYYRDIARRLGYSCNIYVTLILGVDKELIPPMQIQQNLDYADSRLRLIVKARPSPEPTFE